MYTAMVAREKMTALLQDVGLLNRVPTGLAFGLPTAAQIREALDPFTRPFLSQLLDCRIASTRAERGPI